MGTVENTTCSDTGVCNCKPGHSGPKCIDCDKGYYKNSDGICKGIISRSKSI